MKWIINHIKSIKSNSFLVFGETKHEYFELSELVEKYFLKISSIIEPGKIVAILSDYSFESVAVFFSLYRNNNIIVPITTKVNTEIQDKLNTARCDYTIQICKGELILVQIENKSNSHKLVDGLVSNGFSGLILFSSGSTGTPKAMIHNLDNLIDSFKDKRNKEISILVFLMFDHIGGLNTLLSCISMGVTLVFPSNRNPAEVCYAISKFNINVLPASPTFLNLILLSGAYLQYDVSCLRMITYGTEPMPESLLSRLKDVFPKVKFSQTFGTSETGISQMSSQSSNSTMMRFDDINTEWKVINGELYIRSKTQVLGYLNSSMERFTDDGWFRTGDLVEESSNGYFKIIGRNSEVINVGGEKVLPSEVESVLFQHHKVRDCLVYGESNPITGQVVVAKILYSDSTPLTQIKSEIRDFCKNRLDKYKIPVKILLMTDSEYSERFKKKRLQS